MISAILGGIGLFLVGMILVTDSLKAAAGDSLRRTLLRFTGRPWKALASGVVITALIQSSSATTLATLGFVGAGLLTFPQALGVVFGASLGTTATSWIVSLVGLKFSMSTIALPIVGLGAGLRLFSKGRMAYAGMTFAGFGILFVGIDTLQSGMRDLAERVAAADLPGETLGGKLLLAGMGVAITVLTQSSSAAIATTLAALHEGTILLDQAAAIAIGANAGTAVTAAIAVIGGSVAAKRTALAQIVFNTASATLAFVLLPLILQAAAWIAEGLGQQTDAITLAAFHTLFNLAGVCLIFPFTERFAAAIRRIIPDRGPPLTRRLDSTAKSIRSMAMEAVRLTVFDIAAAVAGALRQMLILGKRSRAGQEIIEAARLAVDESKRYVSALPSASGISVAEHQRSNSTMHALDHMDRLLLVLDDRHLPIVAGDGYSELRNHLLDALHRFIRWSQDPASPSPSVELGKISAHLAESRRRGRIELLDRAALGEASTPGVLRELDATRWLDRLAYGLWRLATHLEGERLLGGDDIVVDADAPEAGAAGPAGDGYPD